MLILNLFQCFPIFLFLQPIYQAFLHYVLNILYLSVQFYNIAHLHLENSPTLPNLIDTLALISY